MTAIVKAAIGALRDWIKSLLEEHKAKVGKC
jgi:hypothetical protein